MITARIAIGAEGLRWSPGAGRRAPFLAPAAAAIRSVFARATTASAHTAPAAWHQRCTAAKRMLFPVLTAGLLAGLASAPHCAVMCGPLCAYACQGRGGTLSYHLGRLCTYTLLGAAAGGAGAQLGRWTSSRWLPAVLCWSLAAALLLRAGRLWRAPAGAPGGAPLVLRPGRRRARPAPASARWAHLARRVAAYPAALGALSALLPCGALLAALSLSAGTLHPVLGGLSMLLFALASASGLAVAGVLSARPLLRRTAGRRAMAVILSAGAVLLALRPLPALLRDDRLPPCHAAPALPPAPPPGGEHDTRG
jgi:hypothetical protein